MSGGRELVVIGRIVKPHGIRGEVAVESLSDVPGRFDAGLEVEVAGRRRAIAASREHQGRMLLRFDDVPDRTAAEGLRGYDVLAEPLDLSDSETYFVHELVGLAVHGEDGAPLGTVSGLVELPTAAAYDLLEVARPDGSSWLLPCVDDYVEVDEDDAGRLTLRLVGAPEGLVSDQRADG